MTQFVLHSLRQTFARPLLLLVLSLWTLQGLQAQTDKPVILVFGDSLSAGYRMEEAQGWVALLADKLAAQNSPFEVMNASVSGETTVGGLARLPAALATHQPAVVILELGGNDGLRGLPVANIRQNLVEMVKLSQAAGAKVILAGMQIPPNYGPRYTGPFAAQFGEIAAEFELPLIPFLIDGIPQQPELMQDDDIHPRAEAQPLIVDIVWPVLEPVLQSLHPQS
jgi:acyl-CoA thioesterase-1